MAAASNRAQHYGLVSVHVHQPYAALFQRACEARCRAPYPEVPPWKNLDVHPRRTCLRGQLAFVEKDKQYTNTTRSQAGQHSQNMALHPPEQLACGADGDAFRRGFSPCRYMITLVNGYGHQAATAPAPTHAASSVAGFGRNLFLLFVASWFLHLPARVPSLGAVRFDFILVLVLTILALAGRSKEHAQATATDKLLRVLLAYVILTIPFVEWPGSVLRAGIPEFIKAVVFYYFTVAFIRSERDLKALVATFVACQVFRVMEPLYLHLTQGYWGSSASMSNWEFLERLAGAPFDVLNPNGLAAVVCTSLLFLYYLSGLSRITTLAFLILGPACLYALALTGSRSGLIALFVIFVAILIKSKHRFLVGMVGVLALAGSYPFLSADQQDRYLSLFGAGKNNLATAEQRFDSMESNFRVGMRRPFVGHGLGTSREANANFGGWDHPSHNLYLEAFEELGLIGLAIFLLFLNSILKASTRLRRAYAGVSSDRFPSRLVDALQVWLWMNLIFSLASYGLSSYEWYLMSGLMLVLQRLAAAAPETEAARVTV